MMYRIMMKLPTEVQHIIATYVVPPVYRLAYCLKNHIHWEGLAHNTHPDMLSLIDGYFERCLTIQSHLDYRILLHLRFNPIAGPLLEKYQYFILKYKLWHVTGQINPYLQPATGRIWDGHTPADWSKAGPLDFSSHPRIMDYIREGTIRVKELPLHLKFALYQNPAIFEVEPELTKDACHKWVQDNCHS